MFSFEIELQSPSERAHNFIVILVLNGIIEQKMNKKKKKKKQKINKKISKKKKKKKHSG